LSVCQAAAAGLQGRAALLLKTLAQGCGVPGPSLVRRLLQLCPDLSWTGQVPGFCMLEMEVMRKLEMAAEAGALDDPELAAMAGEVEFHILGRLSEALAPASHTPLQKSWRHIGVGRTDIAPRSGTA
jgi:hypothetical protein